MCPLRGPRPVPWMRADIHEPSGSFTQSPYLLENEPEGLNSSTINLWANPSIFTWSTLIRRNEFEIFCFDIGEFENLMLPMSVA
ncbi:hypothetical protein AFLA_009431 [Aspergillus flavus NRRL3357]|nr:hypothetical protein AFLA_009431 [Aspergillus flavus NRRL3357]